MYTHTLIFIGAHVHIYGDVLVGCTRKKKNTKYIGLGVKKPSYQKIELYS